jgi:hypothetical protein
VEVRTINEHLKNIYIGDGLTEEAAIRKNLIVEVVGTREVKRDVLFYNLDAIITIDYRVSSIRVKQFRQCAIEGCETSQFEDICWIKEERKMVGF